MNAGSKGASIKADIIKAIKRALEKSDVVGSFNTHGSKLWGSFLIKGEEIDHALKQVTKEFMSVDFITLNRIHDSSMIEKCLSDWARGD